MHWTPCPVSRIASPLLAMLLAGSAAQAVEIFTLRSGNGPVGNLDPQITMFVGPANTYMAPLSAPDFASAQAGPHASIINRNGWWIPSLNYDPAARWISNTPAGASEGSSVLYCIPFTVTAAGIDFATLDFEFAVDNTLGGNGNQGLYLNGHPLAGSTGGSYNSHFHIGPLSVGSLLHSGLNHLYIVANDLGGPAGLLFSAHIEVTESAVETQDAAAAFELGMAWPNPFNPMTEIAYTLAETGTARLVVHDLAGRQIAVLADGLQARGRHRVRFDGAGLSSGVYFYTLEAGGQSRTRRALLVK